MKGALAAVLVMITGACAGESSRLGDGEHEPSQWIRAILEDAEPSDSSRTSVLASTGATVHLVTAELDDGPIVLQAAVPVHDGDTVETLAARILVEEHRLYPQAIGIVLDGKWRIDGRRFVTHA